MKRIPWLFVYLLGWFPAACLSGADTRADFLKVIERPRVPLAPRVEEWPATNGIAQTHFSFASGAEQRVPGVLLKATNSPGRRPAVIALHGTGGSKQSLLRLLRDLAGKGFIALAIDAPHHGERTRAGNGSVAYQEAIIRAWREPREHPFYYDTVRDVMRLVDYLETRKDVDPKRIGLIGFSKGGIEAYLAAAVDTRIAVAVPCIGVQGFRWALENNVWQSRIGTIQAAFDTAAKESGVTAPDTAFVKKFYDRVAPGICAEFDGPLMLPLIAPRPLLVINGDSDDRTPLPGLKECADAAQKAYRAAGVEDRFVVRIQEKTGHKVTPESERAAIEWFVRWLKP